MDLICDTNVWYDIAAGRRDPRALKDAGHRLLATPVSFIEIVSELADDNFAVRSAAAQAVVEFADDVVMDTDRHFAALWGLPVPSLSLDWGEAFKAVGMASDLRTLRSSVHDPVEQVTRAVRPEIAASLRLHWSSFADDMEILVDKFFPGYLEARRAKTAKYANEEEARPFAKESNLPEIEMFTSVGTRYRAALHLPTPPDDASDEAIARVSAQLLPYVRAYSRYVLNCATRYAPRPNDWGDLECFAYLQGNRRLLTRDKRWLVIAAEADLASWLLDPESPV